MTWAWPPLAEGDPVVGSVANPSIVHVHPVDDLVDHELVGDGCTCGVTVEPVKNDDGSVGWLHIHHSLDGRETREAV
jgi:hypothetical protein